MFAPISWLLGVPGQDVFLVGQLLGQKTVINELFLPRQSEIVGFFEKILGLDEAVQLVKYPEKLEVIDMYYYANCPLGFLMVQPAVEFCHADNFVSETTLSLEHYDDGDIDAIGLNIMELNNIGMEEGDDSIFLEDSKVDLERKFLINCWNEAKKKYPLSKIKAFGMASDGSGYTFDMDNGTRIKEKDGNPVIEEYLNSLGIFSKKRLLDV